MSDVLFVVFITCSTGQSLPPTISSSSKKKQQKKASRQQLALSLPSPWCVTYILSDISELEEFRGGKNII